MIWVLVGYMWLFLHRPFEIWPIFATIRLERTYMIFTLIAWFAISAKTWTSNRNNVALFFVAFSIFISTLLSPFFPLGQNLTTENWFKVFVFFLLTMTSVKTEKDFKILITAFSACQFLYMLHSYREYLCGAGVYRMGTRRMVGVDSTMSDPNTFAASVNLALPMLFPLYYLVKQLKSKTLIFRGNIFILASFILSTACILLTGSRTGLIVLCFMLLVLGMMSKYRVRIIVGLCILAPLVWTVLPEDRQLRFMTIIDPSVGPANAQASADSRSEFFWLAVNNVWPRYPIFGTGPEGFAIASGTSMQTHSLYAQVLSELGLIGVCAYLCLIFAIWSNHLAARDIYKSMKRQKRESEVIYYHSVSFAVAWSVVLLLILGLAGHNAFRYTWLWYAAFQSIAIGIMREKLEAVPVQQMRRQPIAPRPPGAVPVANFTPQRQ